MKSSAPEYDIWCLIGHFFTESRGSPTEGGKNVIESSIDLIDPLQHCFRGQTVVLPQSRSLPRTTPGRKLEVSPDLIKLKESMRIIACWWYKKHVDFRKCTMRRMNAEISVKIDEQSGLNSLGKVQWQRFSPFSHPSWLRPQGLNPVRRGLQLRPGPKSEGTRWRPIRFSA